MLIWSFNSAPLAARRVNAVVERDDTDAGVEQDRQRLLNVNRVAPEAIELLRDEHGAFAALERGTNDALEAGAMPASSSVARSGIDA
jgi:hypothetical protein